MNSPHQIRYSLGRDKYDNQPKQLAADSFDDFQKIILSTRSCKKGQTFFTSGFNTGQHTDTEKYPENSSYRLKKLALPRRFMPLDFDGFSTPAAYQSLVTFLGKFRGFGYETWSHKPFSPRARAVLELSRPITANESLQVGLMLEEEIGVEVGRGLVLLDKSVYQLEQPVYVAPENANSFIFNGDILNVDRALHQSLPALSLGLRAPRELGMHKLDELTASFLEKTVSPDETPRQITIVMNMLKHISADCEYEVYRRVIWAILSTGWDCAEEIAYDWSMTVPSRFNQATLDSLFRHFNVDLINCPSYGTIKYLARQGGWDGQ